MEQMNEQTRQKIEKIAVKLGVTVEDLLCVHTPQQIIEEYDKGALKMLND